MDAEATVSNFADMWPCMCSSTVAVAALSELRVENLEAALSLGSLQVPFSVALLSLTVAAKAVPHQNIPTLEPKHALHGSGRERELPSVVLAKLKDPPAPPNYPLRNPKYHLIETIRPLTKVNWGV